MKLCERGLNYVQIFNDQGDVRVCSWTRDGKIGSLLDCDLEELFHGEKAARLRKRLAAGDYSECNRDSCPWICCHEVEDHLIEIEEVPRYPEALYLAYENVCNYNCSSCNIHERYLAMDKKELEQRYDRIEEAIKDALPHIKHLSANGQGEVFCSKRILKILSEWKPLAPKEEVSASLETNGSLFDEVHWKQIENLGQYNLSVAISVMSFNEYTYQRLSGTKLPISQIENNLRFVKKLREEGIINRFVIATVVQERNFREMPEFARRCVEEFGADYVRLRAYIPWGKKSREVEWFADVINPYHPYHEEFLEIMKAPIFKHPKVHAWWGGLGTLLGEHPYQIRNRYSQRKIEVLQKMIFNPEVVKEKIDADKSVVVYGLGEVGKSLIKILQDFHIEVAYIMDSRIEEKEYCGIKIYSMDQGKDIADKEVYLIITPMGENGKIEKQMTDIGFDRQNMTRAYRLFLD